MAGVLANEEEDQGAAQRSGAGNPGRQHESKECPLGGYPSWWNSGVGCTAGFSPEEGGGSTEAVPNLAGTNPSGLALGQNFYIPAQSSEENLAAFPPPIPKSTLAFWSEL